MQALGIDYRDNAEVVRISGMFSYGAMENGDCGAGRYIEIIMSLLEKPRIATTRRDGPCKRYPKMFDLDGYRLGTFG